MLRMAAVVAVIALKVTLCFWSHVATPTVSLLAMVW